MNFTTLKNVFSLSWITNTLLSILKSLSSMTTVTMEPKMF